MRNCLKEQAELIDETNWAMVESGEEQEEFSYETGKLKCKSWILHIHFVN